MPSSDTQALRQRHFEALYAASDDPWDVRHSWYERRKRSLLLACLGKPRYRSVFEPGCGNGEMSAALALRSDRVLACDGSASALAAARCRLDESDAFSHDGAPRADVRLQALNLPAEWPRAERFDLVVVSELAYYFDTATLRALFADAAATLNVGGELALCHYRHDFDDRVTSTDDAHAIAGATAGLTHALRHVETDFVIEVWRKVEDEAVA